MQKFCKKLKVSKFILILSIRAFFGKIKMFTIVSELFSVVDNQDIKLLNTTLGDRNQSFQTYFV